jgi:XapX domain-containing protein
MKAYFIALGVGLVAGLLYGGLGVKSPAPPVIALVGLLGMLGGEQAVGWARVRWFSSAQTVHATSITLPPQRSNGRVAQALPAASEMHPSVDVERSDS